MLKGRFTGQPLEWMNNVQTEKHEAINSSSPRRLVCFGPFTVPSFVKGVPLVCQLGQFIVRALAVHPPSFSKLFYSCGTLCTPQPTVRLISHPFLKLYSFLKSSSRVPLLM